MDTTNKKPFNLGDILSITTGRLVSPRGINGVKEALSFMTKDIIHTIAVPRALPVCSIALIEEHPFLFEWSAEINSQLEDENRELTKQDIQEIILPYQVKLGCSDLPVSELKDGKWLRIDPTKECQARFGNDRVTTVIFDG